LHSSVCLVLICAPLVAKPNMFAPTYSSHDSPVFFPLPFFLRGFLFPFASFVFPPFVFRPVARFSRSFLPLFSRAYGRRPPSYLALAPFPCAGQLPPFFSPPIFLATLSLPLSPCVSWPAAFVAHGLSIALLPCRRPCHFGSHFFLPFHLARPCCTRLPLLCPYIPLDPFFLSLCPQGFCATSPVFFRPYSTFFISYRIGLFFFAFSCSLYVFFTYVRPLTCPLTSPTSSCPRSAPAIFAFAFHVLPDLCSAHLFGHCFAGFVLLCIRAPLLALPPLFACYVPVPAARAVCPLFTVSLVFNRFIPCRFRFLPAVASLPVIITIPFLTSSPPQTLPAVRCDLRLHHGAAS